MATSTSSTQPATPSENRFARFTTDDHSAPIWIASILSLIFAVCILGVRLGFVKLKAHGLDDVILTLGHVAGFGMWGSLFSSLENGLGKSVKLLVAANIPHMQKSFYASRMLLFIALALSKCSALVFIQSVFNRMPKISFVAHITLFTIGVWGLVGVIATAIVCPSDSLIPLSESKRCASQLPWAKALTGLDVATEVVITTIPIIGLRGLQIPIKRRLLVVFAFSFRLLNILTSVMHLKAISDFSRRGRLPVDISYVVVWQNVLLSYNLMSATIPALKGFVIGFGTGGVGLGEGTTPRSSGYTNSYRLQSLSKSRTRAMLQPEGYTECEAHIMSVQPNQDGGSPTMDESLRNRRRTDEDGNASIVSSHSRQIMLKREWAVVRE